jgi:RNA polymerase sigma-70 factor (ECF subfamily)
MLNGIQEPTVERPKPDGDRAVRLEQALQMLPPTQRELIALKIEGGLTFAEIGSILGISPNTAASRYRYALAKLRTALEE